MCGILLSLNRKPNWDSQWWNEVSNEIKHRGPDIHSTSSHVTVAGDLKLCSSVLGIRAPLTKQPLVSDMGSILQFNGELYNSDITGNDTQYILRKMDQVGVLETINNIKGEYAFTYYDPSERRIWFGRDPIGRRSLLWKFTQSGLAVSSVGMPDTGFAEVPGGTVFYVDIARWQYRQFPRKKFGNVSKLVYDDMDDSWAARLPHHLEAILLGAVKRRVDSILRVIEPAHRAKDGSYDGNVRFVESSENGDKKISSDSSSSKPESLSRTVSSLANGSNSSSESPSTSSSSSSPPTSSSPSPSNSSPNSCPDSPAPLTPLTTTTSTATTISPEILPSRPVRLAVLFSGGLDCTLLALMIHRILPPNETIDLLNVAFENKRVGEGFETPDRKLGRRSHAELEAVTETTDRFRFVEIDIPYGEVVTHRRIITNLMWPKDNVMDLSIAMAFYFASRGIGSVVSSDGKTRTPYHSLVPVLISGLGADELFGGYSRHASKIQNGHGYDELAQELQLDFDRLHERNLGRDDRVCAVWGKELRYPFLDEEVVKWSLDCPINQKVAKMLDGAVEGKLILRAIALKNGLEKVATEKKRAIQFGARSAKMEIGSGKLKGTDKLEFE